MTERLVSGETYYGHGEHRQLSSAMIAGLEVKIENILDSTDVLSYDSYQLSDKTDVSIGVLDSLAVVENGLGALVPVEAQLTVMQMYRRVDAVEKILTITATEKALIYQTAMYQDYAELHTLTEEYVTSPLRERYVIYRYADGSYEASVEQHDLLDEKGAMATRPMTIYDDRAVVRYLTNAVQSA